MVAGRPDEVQPQSAHGRVHLLERRRHAVGVIQRSELLHAHRPAIEYFRVVPVVRDERADAHVPYQDFTCDAGTFIAWTVFSNR